MSNIHSCFIMAFQNIEKVAIVLFFLLGWLCISCNPKSTTTKIYVSSSGSDHHDGSVNKPFLSIDRAIKSIEENKQPIIGKLEIILDGTIPIEKPIIVTYQDFKNVKGGVTFRSKGGNQAVISGGKEIANWELSKMPGIYKAKVEVDFNFRELYVNGRLATIAKGKESHSRGWTKLDDPYLIKENLLKTYTTFQGEKEAFEGYMASGPYVDIINWKNPEDLEFVYLQAWTYVVCPVESVEKTGSDRVYIKMYNPTFKDAQIKGGVQVNDPSYMQNALELLDEPNEWYFDRKDREIYYMPERTSDMATKQFVIPVVDNVLSIEGQPEEKVNGVQFKNIHFQYCSFPRPGIDGFAEVQATFTKHPDIDDNMHSHMISTDAGIEVSYADSILFDNCIFSHFGGGGLQLKQGTRFTRINGCIFAQIGASGIQIDGFDIEYAHPMDSRNTLVDNRVTNCIIADIGTVYKGGVGIISGFNERTQIINNEIHDIAYSGISVGWGWGLWDAGGIPERPSGKMPDYYHVFDKPTISHGHVVSDNHIYNVMKVLHDGAGIYTLSWMPETVISGNHIHDNPPRTDLKLHPDSLSKTEMSEGWPGGIYLDEGSGKIKVTGNLVYNVAQPFNYNDVHYSGLAWDEREATNDIHGNYFSDMPDNDERKYLSPKNVLDITAEQAKTYLEIIENAGLKSEYNYLFELYDSISNN